MTAFGPAGRMCYNVFVHSTFLPFTGSVPVRGTTRVFVKPPAVRMAASATTSEHFRSGCLLRPAGAVLRRGAEARVFVLDRGSGVGHRTAVGDLPSKRSIFDCAKTNWAKEAGEKVQPIARLSEWTGAVSSMRSTHSGSEEAEFIAGARLRKAPKGADNGNKHPENQAV